jgi:hypothetical protein
LSATTSASGLQAYLRPLLFRLRRFPLDQVGHLIGGLGQGFFDRRRVALVGGLQCHGNHRARLQIDRMLGFVGQMGGAILHLGDPRIRVARTHPLRVGHLLLTFPVQLRQLFPARLLQPGLLGQFRQKLLILWRRYPAGQWTASPHWLPASWRPRPLSCPSAAAIGYHAQHPAKHFAVGIQIDQPPGAGEGGVIGGFLIEADVQEPP